MYDAGVMPGPRIVRLAAAPGHDPVRSPLSGRSGVFVATELWSGDEPGGVLRPLGQIVLGDVVRLVSEVDGAEATIVLRHVHLASEASAPRVALPDAWPAELVPLLARAPARRAQGLVLVERVFAEGHRFAWEPEAPASLRDLDSRRHGG